MNTTMKQCEATEMQQTCSEATVQTFRPRADIYEVDEAWFIDLELPGVDESSAEVGIDKSVLTVTGSARPFDTEGFENHFGGVSRRFERSFRLPEDVDTSGIDAQVKNGVLRLRLPKSAAALPHKVTVKAG